MILQEKSRVLTLRELAGYLFVLTIVALVIVFGWMLARMFEPRGDWHMLARASDLDYETPTRFYLTARDGTRINIWIAFVGEWRAFDGLTPTWFAQNCLFGWQQVTSRFEDPCSGAKFSAAGKYLEGYIGAARPLATDLIQYRTEIRQDQLWINLDDKIIPAPVPPALR